MSSKSKYSSLRPSSSANVSVSLTRTAAQHRHVKQPALLTALLEAIFSFLMQPFFSTKLTVFWQLLILLQVTGFISHVPETACEALLTRQCELEDNVSWNSAV